MSATFLPGFRPDRDEIMARYGRKEVLVSKQQTVPEHGEGCAGLRNNPSVGRSACRVSSFWTAPLPSILILISRAASTLMNSVEVNWLP